MKYPPERALTVLVDSREPHPHAGDPPEALFRPWRIQKRERIYPPTERVTLREGDYSAPGMALWKPLGDDGPWRGEPLVVIERKSLSDAVSSVVGSVADSLGERRETRERFEEELIRMRAYAWRAIVIEGTQQCETCGRGWAEGRHNPYCVQCEEHRPGRRFSAASVLSSYAVFSSRFGVQVWWSGSSGARAQAEWYVGTMLGRLWSEHTGGADYRKAVARGEVSMLPWARAAKEKEAGGVVEYL